LLEEYSEKNAYHDSPAEVDEYEGASNKSHRADGDQYWDGGLLTLAVDKIFQRDEVMSCKR